MGCEMLLPNSHERDEEVLGRMRTIPDILNAVEVELRELLGAFQDNGEFVFN